MATIKKKKRRPKAPAGAGSFRVRESGSIEYRTACIDMYGNLVRKSFTAPTKEECIAKAEAFNEKEAQKARGIDVDATIPQIVEARYKIDLAMNFVGIQGYSRNMETLRIIARSPLGRMPIVNVNKYHIFSFLATVTNYANSTIEKIYNQLKIAFADAFNQEIITRNIMLDRDVRRPKSDKPDKKVRAYSKEEQDRIVQFLENYKPRYGKNDYHNQLLLEIYTGLRMGEINALRPEDVDLKLKVINVRRTISKGIGTEVFVNDHTKTKAGNRVVPLTKKAEAVIRNALEQMRRNDEDLIFYDYTKKQPICTNQVNSFFKRACDKLDLEYNGQHALRHTFATRCLEANLNPDIVKTWMGHTDIHVTLDTYSDVLDSLNRSAINRLDEVDEIA